MFATERLKIGDKPIRLIELFGGIGSQAMALRDLEKEGFIPNGWETWKLVEFDKYCIKSYNAIHGTNFETVDIKDVHGEDLEVVDTDKYDYILTYSFPCQDLSLAGKGKGMAKGDGTRSGLLWEVERILYELADLDRGMPSILLLENVPQVHGKRNIDDFNSWLESLSKLGYVSEWADLNAKDYGVAQNRNRCFCVSWREQDKFYEFPETIELMKTMADYLEESVDEKYYIVNEKADKLINDLIVEGKLPSGQPRIE